MPARRHSSTAAIASSRGGSIRPTRPSSTRSPSTSSKLRSRVPCGMGLAPAPAPAALGRQGLDLACDRVDRLGRPSPVAAAHGRHRLGRAFQIDHRAVLVAVVQRRHEAMLRIEGNLVGARELLGRQREVHAGLGGKRDQRAFHRIAVDDPAALVAAAERGVVAKQRGLRELLQDRPLGRFDLASVEQHFAARLVAHARHLERVLARDDDLATVISLRVNVPVLSEQITVTEPSVSTAGAGG
jgi:hypothetical protein